MTIIHPPPTPAYPGRRWEARHYPGTAPTCARFRSELRDDLTTLAGIPRQAREDIELCANEAFANAVRHSRSQQPGGSVIRLLSTPLVMGRKTTMRLCVIDEGPSGRPPARPFIPPQVDRRPAEEWETTESGRGLLLIHRLADEWGTRPWPCPETSAELGTVLWAEFTFTCARCTCGGAR
ncbi:ATP-binding protein [Nocardiopsis xinjiangensis]|uniref:ATP-binding protein n=1 Tax=Nocardiopsis xinjiangensis TaxID=124285 RepID=UPI0003459E91|nr:ATP-binding protein [Nocardiopsis xinjiangensis]